jgi:hypothetical protein
MLEKNVAQFFALFKVIKMSVLLYFLHVPISGRGNDGKYQGRTSSGRHNRPV